MYKKLFSVLLTLTLVLSSVFISASGFQNGAYALSNGKAAATSETPAIGGVTATVDDIFVIEGQPSNPTPTAPRSELPEPAFPDLKVPNSDAGANDSVGPGEGVDAVEPVATDNGADTPGDPDTAEPDESDDHSAVDETDASDGDDADAPDDSEVPADTDETTDTPTDEDADDADTDMDGDSDAGNDGDETGNPSDDDSSEPPDKDEITFIEAFPDSHFRLAVLDILNADGAERTPESILDEADAAVLAGLDMLAIEGKSISDVTGIEYFKNITVLKCAYNYIQKIDLSKNTALKSIGINRNEISELVLPQSESMEYLYFYGNKLETLDLSRYVNLKEAYGWSNDLTELTLPSGGALVRLDINDNMLKKLDTSNSPALEGLVCTNNELSGLDVTRNANLKMLIAQNNRLTEIDVTNNPLLESLYVGENLLETLDVTKNTKLIELSCKINKLKELDLSKNADLEWLSCLQNDFTKLDFSKNGKLGFVNCTENLIALPADIVGWQELGLEINTPDMTNYGTLRFYPQKEIVKFTYLQAFPDANFRRAVLKLLNADGADRTADSAVTEADKAFLGSVKSLNLSLVIIRNMAGIEYFTGLLALNCSWNLLTELDLSKNASLVDLRCFSNQLKKLNLPQGAQLETLNCSNNFLAALDLSKYASLKKLYCTDNYLAELLLPPTGTLFEIYCDNNKLTALDVSKNAGLLALNCAGNRLSALDLTYCKKLKHLRCESNRLEKLYIYGCTQLTELYCGDNDLPELDVSSNIYLESLVCRQNRISRLNLSKNTALIALDCNQNLLAELDISANAGLNWMFCNDNEIKKLDLTKNRRLMHVDCQSNRIPTPEDITGWREIGLRINSQSDINGGSLRYYMQKSTEAILYRNAFPDPNFLKEVLIIMNADGGGRTADSPVTDGDVAVMAAVTALNVSSKNIEDLTGVEYFSGITSINCIYNRIKYLDLSQNAKLSRIEVNRNELKELIMPESDAPQKLYCYYNELTKLDLSANTGLTHIYGWHNYISELILPESETLLEIYCYENELSSVDLTKNPNLELLVCIDNMLTSLNVSQNTHLQVLQCAHNKLTELDLSNNPELYALYCEANGLTALDVSKNIALTEMNCKENQLAQLDLSKNTELGWLSCLANQFTSLDLTNCIALEFINCTLNYFKSPDDVLGWRELGLTINSPENMNSGNMRFYPQNVVDSNTFAKAFPDANFRQAVLDLLNEDGGARTSATVVSNEDIADMAGRNMLDLEDKAIADLTGIKYFTGIELLYVGYNELKTLDLSANSALRLLYCYVNNLTELIISPDAPLEILNCNYNELTKLDLSGFSTLGEINCEDNKLTELILPASETMYAIACYNNNISELDISGLPNLTALNCNQNSLTALNFANNKQIKHLYVAVNLLTELDVSNSPYLDTLDCGDNKLTSLDITSCGSLIYLHCAANELTELDVTMAPGLKFLNCLANRLTVLDLANNAELAVLACIENDLTSLDLTNNPKLEAVSCTLNYFTDPSVVKGWEELGLIINSPEDPISGSFQFYPQKSGAALPEIAITEQPEPLTIVTEDKIAGTLGVKAEVTLLSIPQPGYEIKYQWYKNDDAETVGGQAMAGAESPVFAIPLDLKASGSPYYYYCVLSAVDAADVATTIAEVLVVKETVLNKTALQLEIETYAGAILAHADETVNKWRHAAYTDAAAAFADDAVTQSAVDEAAANLKAINGVLDQVIEALTSDIPNYEYLKTNSIMYLFDSWNNFEDAALDAIAVLSGAKPTAGEITTACGKMKAAFESLVLVRFMFADKSVINNITLSTGDSYQIELDTNLDDITYTSLSAGVIVNEKGFLTVTRPGMHVVKIESPNCAIPLTLMISATANLM